MALAEAIPGWYPIPIAPFWTVLAPFASFSRLFAPFLHRFAPFGTVLDRFRTVLSAKHCENLRKFHGKFAKIRESLVLQRFPEFWNLLGTI